MTAPKITGARLVLPRYGAGVYRFLNNRGVSVGHHKDPEHGFTVDPDRWDAIEVAFWGPGPEDFDLEGDREQPLAFGITADELAELALDVRRKAAP